jgi:hypothetical protein
VLPFLRRNRICLECSAAFVYVLTGGTHSSLLILACMHGDIGIVMTLHAAIASKGQIGREHMLHISNEALDALGTSVFYGKTEVFKALFQAKCPSIFTDPEDRSASLLQLRKLSQYAPDIPHHNAASAQHRAMLFVKYLFVF